MGCADLRSKFFYGVWWCDETKEKASGVFQHTDMHQLAMMCREMLLIKGLR